MADGDSNVPDPFASLPMFAEMAKALSGQGPLNWEAARQFAVMAANGGASEPNVEPMARMRLAELAHALENHVEGRAGDARQFGVQVVGAPLVDLPEEAQGDVQRLKRPPFRTRQAALEPSQVAADGLRHLDGGEQADHASRIA